ncbi:MAG: hypothetical protein ICV81_15210 [Flavisolibacter sp.]|nr:hypothetical protein [Flavisolibacter sp.]MBD0285799.1 hypothetical protein [Flavisolibacter sp.]MBD0352218.1 hypothetical protein [Flavisolibacter sp.]MBD0368537.1 hypothetical protein [Flavisolibacter sp.]
MAAFALTMVSCNSGNSNSETAGDDATRNPTPGVLNANGNLPDTSNAMELSTSDSTAHHTKDSLSSIGGDTTNKNNKGTNKR